MTKIIAINCCKDCPKYDDYPDRCMKTGKIIPAPYGIGYAEIPEWCPLPDKQEKGENDNG